MPKYRLMAPGPVGVPERVRLAMAGTLPHHRSPEFVHLYDEVRRGLREVFQTRHPVLVLASSGTGAMEAAASNTLSPGDSAVVVRAGKFGERWGEILTAQGVDFEAVDVEWGHAVDPVAVREAFERRPRARALLVQASETSTGVYHPIEALARIVREREDRLMIVDAISAVGVHDLPMDALGLDVVVSGSQKGFLLPPGLSFVALSPRAEAAIASTHGTRYYFDLRKELEAVKSGVTAYTPAVSLVQGLRAALEILLAEGLPALFRRHRDFAVATRAAATALGLELFAPLAPSHACTAIRVPEGIDGRALISRLRSVYGVTVEGGRGDFAGKIVRIGHMGDLDAFDVLAGVAALEMALVDLGLPVKAGEGARAAMEILHESLTTAAQTPPSRPGSRRPSSSRPVR